MKTKIIFTIISFLLIAGCGSYEQQSTVIINFGSGGNVSKDQFGSTTMPIDAKEIIISVLKGSTSGELLFRERYARDLSVAEITLDAGKSRFFSVEAIDRNNITTYRGTSGPVDLAEGEVTQVMITMFRLQIETAIINLLLYQADETTPFNPLTAADLLNDEVRLSIITLNSDIFDIPVDEEDYETLVIDCNHAGDYPDNTDSYYNTSTINGITVPANAFFIIAVRGYNSNTTDGPITYIRYFGLGNPSQTSNLEPNSDNNLSVDIPIVMKNGYNGSSWESYCQCE